jgi:hypothetical protein
MSQRSALSPLAQRELVDELMRGDLVAFVRRCFETVAPGETLRRNWHISRVPPQYSATAAAAFRTQKTIAPVAAARH